MTELLILLFVLPFSTIIFSIFFEKIIHNPILVSLVIFAIFLILAFVLSDETTLALFIILSIVYAIISFITALITRFIWRIRCNIKITNENNRCDTQNISLLTNGQNSTITSQYPIQYINDILGNNVNNLMRQ